MKKPEPAPREVLPLDELFKCGVSRRTFCAGAGAGLLSLGLAACTTDSARVMIGGIDDPPKTGGGGNPGDMAKPFVAGDMKQPGGGFDAQPTVDASHATDMAQPLGACASSMIKAGAASSFAMSTGTKFTDNFTYSFYVCRDSGGLFAMSAACTHNGRPMQASGGGWYCPSHGATFAFDGTSPTSPAFFPLQHYLVCVDGSGTVFVDPKTNAATATRV